MPRPLSEQVVVITGASSGIGRETALKFAEQGATVVLAARNEAALREVADQCRERGGRAVADIVDVAEWEQVERLANQTVAQFDRIDTWVNNAAVSVYSTVEKLAIEEIERVIQVDLMGQIYGIKAVLPHMRRQGGGTIICVASVVASRSIPLQAPYCAAKHGVQGFVESLRMELEREKTGIQVTQINPASINTPFFRHARSKVGALPSPLPPVYQPSLVADAIVDAAEHPVREIFVGGAGKLIDVMQRISPRLMDWYMLQNDRGVRQQVADQPDDGQDNLLEPLLGSGSTTGEWNGRSMSLYTRVFERHPELKRVAVGIALAGAAALLGGLSRRSGNGSTNGRPQVAYSAGRLLQAATDQFR